MREERLNLLPQNLLSRIQIYKDPEYSESETVLEAEIEVNGKKLLKNVTLWSHETFQDRLDKHLKNELLRSFKIISIRRGFEHVITELINRIMMQDICNEGLEEVSICGNHGKQNERN